MAFASGESVEKLAVSFNLDQVAESIDQKRPNSPREAAKDGEYVEEEVKFLPPPKTVIHPRLFVVRADGSGEEWLNHEMLSYLFREK